MRCERGLRSEVNGELAEVVRVGRCSPSGIWQRGRTMRAAGDRASRLGSHFHAESRVLRLRSSVIWRANGQRVTAIYGRFPPQAVLGPSFTAGPTLAESPAAGVPTAEEMGPQLLAVGRLAGSSSHSHVDHASMGLNVKRFRNKTCEKPSATPPLIDGACVEVYTACEMRQQVTRIKYHEVTNTWRERHSIQRPLTIAAWRTRCSRKSWTHCMAPKRSRELFHESIPMTPTTYVSKLPCESAVAFPRQRFASRWRTWHRQSAIAQSTTFDARDAAGASVRIAFPIFRAPLMCNGGTHMRRLIGYLRKNAKSSTAGCWVRR